MNKHVCNILYISMYSRFSRSRPFWLLLQTYRTWKPAVGTRYVHWHFLFDVRPEWTRRTLAGQWCVRFEHGHRIFIAGTCDIVIFSAAFRFFASVCNLLSANTFLIRRRSLWRAIIFTFPINWHSSLSLSLALWPHGNNDSHVRGLSIYAADAVWPCLGIDNLSWEIERMCVRNRMNSTTSSPVRVDRHG